MRGRSLGALTLWGLVVLLVGALAGVGTTSGDEPNRAGLAVTFADGSTETRCVEFEEDEISGVDLLRRSGLTFVLSDSGGFGKAVCRLGDTGCDDPGDCFCQCRGGDCGYWAYFALESEEWRLQAVGASGRRLRHGDADGWIWGAGREPPDTLTFGEICPVPAPAETIAPPSVATTRPPPAQDAPASATPTIRADVMKEAQATDEEPARVESRRPADGATAGSDDTNGGAPLGLIAFGVVAALLAAAIGGFALRRRVDG